MRKLHLNLAAVVLAVAGCVTVNVVLQFPAAQLQSAADEIVEDVQQEKDEAASAEHWIDSYVLYASNGTELYAPAEDSDINIKVTNAKITALKGRMKQRFATIKALKDRGAIGENLKGHVETRVEGFGSLSMQEKGRAKRTVAAENADRKALYLELLAANNIGKERLGDLQKIFSNSWYKAARPTWFVRVDDAAEAAAAAEDGVLLDVAPRDWITKAQWEKEKRERESGAGR